MPTYEFKNTETDEVFEKFMKYEEKVKYLEDNPHINCLLYTSPSPRDKRQSRMPSSA